MVEMQFLASFCASWAKNCGDSSVRGIKTSNRRKLCSYADKMSMPTVTFSVVSQPCSKLLDNACYHVRFKGV